MPLKVIIPEEHFRIGYWKGFVVYILHYIIIDEVSALSNKTCINVFSKVLDIQTCFQ